MNIVALNSVGFHSVEKGPGDTALSGNRHLLPITCCKHSGMGYKPSYRGFRSCVSPNLGNRSLNWWTVGRPLEIR